LLLLYFYKSEVIEMGLLDGLFRRKKPKTETKKVGPEQAVEKPAPPSEFVAQSTKELEESPAVAEVVSKQQEVVVESAEGAALSPPEEVKPVDVKVTAGDYVNEGVDVYQKGDYQAALSKFKAAAELDPTMAAAWSNMGCALGQLGDCDGALKAFNTALEIDPKSQQAKEGKELCLKMLNTT
jgi:Flp pilus assembly protein TadD